MYVFIGGHAIFGIKYLGGGTLRTVGMGVSYNGEGSSDSTCVQPIITLNSSVRLTGNSANGWDLE